VRDSSLVRAKCAALDQRCIQQVDRTREVGDRKAIGCGAGGSDTSAEHRTRAQVPLVEERVLGPRRHGGVEDRHTATEADKLVRMIEQSPF